MFLQEAEDLILSDVRVKCGQQQLQSSPFCSLINSASLTFSCDEAKQMLNLNLTQVSFEQESLNNTRVPLPQTLLINDECSLTAKVDNSKVKKMSKEYLTERRSKKNN